MKKLILLIETATTSCSVALSADGEIVALCELNESNVHARLTTQFVDEVVKSSGYTFGDLSAIAVSKGPGSYTGLRIGVSVAKGLCYALDLPLISVNTLLSMAAGYLQNNEIRGGDLLIPMVDARRMEVYTAVFDASLGEVAPTAALIPDSDSFIQFPGRKILFGDGAAKFSEMFASRDDVEFRTLVNSAAYMANIARRKLDLGELEDVAYFEPYYLKEFIATQPRVR